MIHLVGPVALAAALAGTGVYGLLARRNAVLVLIGAELILNAANVLLLTANSLPAGGLAALANGGSPANGSPGNGPAEGSPADVVGMAAAGADPLLSGQVMTIFVVTIAAAEIGLALAVILLLYRRRQTSDLEAVRELGEASATFTVPDDAGEWPAEAASSGVSGGTAAAGVAGVAAGGAGNGAGNGPRGRQVSGAGQVDESTLVPGRRSEVRQQ